MLETNCIQQTIEVRGERCEVTARKTGKTTWKALGSYHGKTIEGVSAKEKRKRKGDGHVYY